MKIVATIEARMNSTRLPGKVLLPILGLPALERMIERIRYSRYIDKIIVATTINKEDDKIARLSDKLDVGCYRGSENDVLLRVLDAAKKYKGDLICELTGDCPLIDPFIIDQVILSHLSGTYDYSSNALFQRTFPLGFETRVFPAAVLEKASKMTSDPIDRVHVSCFIYNNPKIFKLNSITANPETFGPDIRVTMDTPEDYKLIKIIYRELYSKNKAFPGKDIVKFLKSNLELLKINNFVRQKGIDEG